VNINYPDVEVNQDGLATLRHTASHHVGRGEVTLCGQFIDYNEWLGEALNAPRCSECDRLDA